METLVTTDIVGKEVRIGDIKPKRMKCMIFDAPKSYRYMNDKVVQRLPEQVIKISD